MQQPTEAGDPPLGTVRPSLDARGQGDIRAAAIFTCVLAGLGILLSLVLVVVPAAQYGVGAFQSELGILIIFAAVGLLFSILWMLLGVAISRRSRLATMVASVLAGLSVFSNLSLLFSGSILSAITGAVGILVAGTYLWVLIHAYQALSAAR